MQGHERAEETERRHRRRELGPFLDRFSLACVDMVLGRPPRPVPHADGRDLEEGEPESLVAGLTELPFPRHEASRWYADSEVLLRLDEGVWIGVLGRTPEALDKFREEHPGFWVERGDVSRPYSVA